MKLLLAIWGALSISMTAAAQSSSSIVSDVLKNSIVKSNSSQMFDAKGFAVALKLVTDAKSVVVESAKDVPLYWTFLIKVPGTDSILTHIVSANVSLTLAEGECQGVGRVYIGKDFNGYQINSIINSGLGSFSWRGPRGPRGLKCIRQTSPLVLQSETQRLTFEALERASRLNH